MITIFTIFSIKLIRKIKSIFDKVVFQTPVVIKKRNVSVYKGKKRMVFGSAHGVQQRLGKKIYGAGVAKRENQK